MMMDAANLPPCGAILAAGGLGTRMATVQPKQLLLLAGKPILVRSCRALAQLPAIKEIVVVAPAAHMQQCRQLCHTLLPPDQVARLIFTPGGTTRQDSVQAGLESLSPTLALVLVHDAARPLVEADLLLRCLHAASCHGAAIAALPVTDTLKDVAAESGTIRATIDRTNLWRAQTPQVVRRDLLQQAFRTAAAHGFQGTDEAALLEHAGIGVQVVAGSERNLKITRPEDLFVAEALLHNSTTRRTNYHTNDNAMKIGHGFDAHRLVAGRKLILGGVDIGHPLGLDGHSDADVVSHALTDAILGALGQGDIGRHFPDTDPKYKGADSLHLLEKTWQLAAQQGLRLANADITIICQTPKLAPYLARMQHNLARCCQAADGQINIKATTTENMGYTGRGEGIAVHAVILLEVVHEG
jgi:2-C-methyl-D-erythritol 4-phosphate cytidylyltransferase/2-C-methyl-D-erythritol 2,4-cyclodiphosphate synthase